MCDCLGPCLSLHDSHCGFYVFFSLLQSPLVFSFFSPHFTSVCQLWCDGLSLKGFWWVCDCTCFSLFCCPAFESGKKCCASPDRHLVKSHAAIHQRRPVLLLLPRCPPSSCCSIWGWLCDALFVWVWHKKVRIDWWIFKIRSVTRQSLWLMAIVGVCHVSWCLCVFEFVCLCVLHSCLAVLFIRRAASLSWQCLRGTSVGVLTKHDTKSEVFFFLLVRMLVCMCAVIARPVVLLLSWQTPTSQLRTHFWYSPRPCMPLGTNTQTHTLIRLPHARTRDWCVSVWSAFLFRGEGAKKETREKEGSERTTCQSTLV